MLTCGGDGGDEHNISSIGGDEQHDVGGYFRVVRSELEGYKRLIDYNTDAGCVFVSSSCDCKRKDLVMKTYVDDFDSICQRSSLIKHHRCITCDDEQQDILIYNLETLDDHINRFDTDPKILDELDKRVKSDKETQTIWFHELRDTWTNPETPVDAFELVACVFHSLYDGLPPPLEFQGFLKHYGLPTYCDGFPEFTAGDIPTYNLEILSDHIKRFDTEPEVLHELDNRVAEDGEGLDFWFQGLRKAWTNPKTPEDASRLVRDVFYKLYNGSPSIFNLQGFLEHYGLPTYWELPEGKKLGFYSQRK